MSHPYGSKSENNVGKARAQKLTAGYARGGRAVRKPSKVEINIGMPNQGKTPMGVPPLPPAVGALAPPGPMAGGGGPPMPPGPPPGAGPFARGGRANKMTAGAESGVGRLQKEAIQKRKR